MHRARVLASILLVAAAPVAASAGAPGAGGRGTGPAPGVLGHQGQWITDPAGRVVIEHGLNVVAKLPPYEPAATGFGPSDAQFLASHGFTAVRLGVILAGVEPAPGAFDEGYLRSIEATVKLLGRYGIKSLLDFHQDQYNELFQGEGFPTWMVQDNSLPVTHAGFPGNYFTSAALNRAYDNFWANSPGPGGVGLQTRYAQAWAHVAAAFRGNAAVLGYDLFNEPWPGTDWASCFPPAGCPVADQQVLAPFEHLVIRAIHAADPTHLAFYEPWLTFDYGAPTYLGAPGDAKSGFDFHAYCLAALGAPETPPTRTGCDALVESRVFANALHQSATSGDALLLSEFGATNDASELHEVIGLADADSVPWLEWAYCACGDPTGSGSGEALVYQPGKPPVGANVNSAELAILDEPYPQAVAGTPEGYSYAAAGDRFTFRYSTARAGGGTFAPGTTTVIYASPLHYPHGYRVELSGARVVSRADAPELVLLADPGAATVSVTVVPALAAAVSPAVPLATGSGRPVAVVAGRALA
ncbi:MAG: cellulase family glycosylhydrolase, partial [Mycobacteriales bacterium]